MSLRRIKNWFRYRIWDRYNIVKIDSLSCDYWDTDTRMLHACFDLLTQFVEQELGWMYMWTHNKSNAWWPPKCFISKYDLKQYGLKYLEWEMTIPEEGENGCPGQAASAKEQEELYDWWTKQRPARKDPYDLLESVERSPREFIPCSDGSGCYTLPPISEEEKRIFDQISTIEQQYEIEDDMMLARLLKIRNTLWT